MDDRPENLVHKLMDHVAVQAVGDAMPLVGQPATQEGKLDWDNPSAVYLQLDTQVRMMRDLTRIPGEKLADPDYRLRTQAALQCLGAGYLLLLSVDSEPGSAALASGGTVGDLTALHGLRYRNLARTLLDHEVECPGHAEPSGLRVAVDLHVENVPGGAPSGGVPGRTDGADGGSR